MNEAIRARLQLDLDELLDDPYPGIHIFPPDANATEFCLVFALSGGPWQGLNLHFKVSFDGRWPATPPIMQSVPSLGHPMLVDSHIACRLLGPKHLPPGYKSLYAIPLRVLFIHLFKRFSDYQVLPCDILTEYFYNVYIHQHVQETVGGDKLGAAAPGESTDRYYVHGGDLTDRSHPDSGLRRAPHREPQANLGLIAELGRSSTEGEFTKRFNTFWIKAYRILSTFQCPSCPYGGDGLPHVDRDIHSTSIIGVRCQPVSINDGAHDKDRVCHLEMLNDDVLGIIALYTPTESLRHLAAIYPRIGWIITSTRLIPRRELTCVFLRRPVRDAILGIGVTLRFCTHTVVSSDFEWISAEAVENHSAGSRYFLPLAFEPRHFKRAKEHIWASIDTINCAILSMYQDPNRSRPKPKDWRWMKWVDEQLEIRKMAGTPDEHSSRSQRSVSVLFWMMENVVESLLQARDEDFEHATKRPKLLNKFTLRNASQVDRTIISYGLLFHLLLCLYRSQSELLRQAADRVRRFKDDTVSKETLPSRRFLDEILILVMIINVLPSVNAHGHADLPPTIDQFLEIIVQDIDSIFEPTLLTLLRTETSGGAPGIRTGVHNNSVDSRKIMFHVLFLQTFKQFYVGEAGLLKLDGDFGFLEDEAIVVMAQSVGEICRASGQRKGKGARQRQEGDSGEILDN